jgi:hypothetical protein
VNVGGLGETILAAGAASLGNTLAPSAGATAAHHLQSNSAVTVQVAADPRHRAASVVRVTAIIMGDRRR